MAASGPQPSVANRIPPMDLPPANENGIHLTLDGNLAWLRKNIDGPLLTTEEVVDHVKVKKLVKTQVNITAKKKAWDVKEEDFVLPPNSKASVIVGTTGAGKTSSIRLLAGGLRTKMKAVSDTQAPTVYVTEDGEVILDTAGLCDTGTLPQDGDSDVVLMEKANLKELLMTTVAGAVRKFQLSIARVYLCVPLNQRIPPTFYELWPSLQNALGGKSVIQFGRILLTMANQASTSDAIALERERETGETYHALQANSLNWKLVECGEENLDDWKEDLVKMDEKGVATLDVESVSTVFVNEAKLREQVAELEKLISDLKSQSSMATNSKEEKQKWIEDKCITIGELRAKIPRAKESCSGYSNAQVAQFESNLRDFEAEVQQAKIDIRNGTVNFDVIKKRIDDSEQSLKHAAAKLQELTGFREEIAGMFGLINSAATGRPVRAR